MNLLVKVLERASKSSDVVLAVAMTAVLGAMIIPLPPWLLDAGIGINLALSAALLVAALYANDALKVTSFPTLLLFTTLLRLSLNVSSTRLALAEGHAGDIIAAFGEFVVRGDYLVGAVIFAILTLVQFLVVAKGAERVAEVAARFSLDAMPGKQMSIDADLRAGAIDQTEARRRRRQLERESQMFGAMDGAMKFVKGDVIASLIIVAINLIGGLLIGIYQHGMELSDAAATYSLIAIGDGLVSQIPSLCISVAAGLVVTRVASEQDGDSLGAEIGAQFFGQARALWIVCGLCVALALVPGMPRIVFIVLAAAAAALAHGVGLIRQKQAEQAATAKPVPPKEDEKSAGGTVGVAPIILDLPSNLASLCEEEEGAFVTGDLERVREAVRAELGVPVPGIRVRVGSPSVPPDTYVVLLDEVPAARGQLVADAAYARVPPAELAFLGIEAHPAVDPITGKPISRVPASTRDRLIAAQIAVATARELCASHVAHVLKKRAASFLGVQEVQTMLSGLELTSPMLVKEATTKVPLPLLVEVLRKLVHEDVSIKNLRVVLETLVSPATEGDANALAERCRQGLHRYISHKFAPAGPLYAYLVDPSVEDVLRDQGPRGQALDPTRVAEILEGVRRIATGGRAVVLAAGDVRRTLRKLCEGSFPEVAVLTYAELDAELQIRPIGRLCPVQATR